MDEKIECVINYFPLSLRKSLSSVLETFGVDLQEIRIRANKPLCLVVGGENVIPDKSLVSTQMLVEDLFMNICEHSVYTYQDDINNGFVTISGGHRVGVCGTAVNKEGRILSIKNISSLNFRIAREYIGCAKKIISPERHNILIVGPPSSGKTTLLRDAARLISNQNKKVAIVDERGELCTGSNSKFDVGIMTDCLCGYKKAVGIEIAVRTLSPQVIVFDEIGTEDEYESIKDCLNCGVDVITSVHSYSKESFLKREFCRKMVDSQIFDTFIFLGKKPGDILEIGGIVK